MTIALVLATRVAVEELTDVVNASFADYVAPIRFSPAALRMLVERDDVVLQRSYVALHDGRTIGAALVAERPSRRGLRARLAAMGVVPTARGHGVGRDLLRRVVESVRSRGARTLLLEVFASNVPARDLYERHGFVAQRSLFGYTLPRSDVLARRYRDDVALRRIAAPGALPLFDAAAAETPDAAPTWQCEGVSLARLAPPVAVYAVEIASALAPVGYLAIGADRPEARLLGLGVLPAERRRGVAAAALAVALQLHPDIAGFGVPPLVPATSSLVPFFAALGATRDAEEQIEMALDPARASW